MSNDLEKFSAGKLYVVATPIGNLADISQRATEILCRVPIIAAEDTRHSQRLLAVLGAKPQQLLAYHDHNEASQSEALLQRLQAGEDIALISDAGTPLISDPGYRLVQQARQQGLEVVAIPGPCALIAALSVSGLPTDRFAFEGFLPAKAGARQQRLQALASESRTLVFYESTHRILDCLTDMLACFGANRMACLARELTKTYETVMQADLAELLLRLQNQPQQQKGEFVVIVAGAAEVQAAADTEIERVLRLLLAELPVKQAAGLAAELLHLPRNQAYRLALQVSADLNVD